MIISELLTDNSNHKTNIFLQDKFSKADFSKMRRNGIVECKQQIYRLQYVAGEFIVGPGSCKRELTIYAWDIDKDANDRTKYRFNDCRTIDFILKELGVNFYSDMDDVLGRLIVGYRNKQSPIGFYNLPESERLPLNHQLITGEY